jgi:ribonuclease VapC
MIVDTSALIAILKSEEDYHVYKNALVNNSGILMSAASYLECAIINDASKRHGAQSDLLDDLINTSGITIAPVTEAQARIARVAYQKYGRGSRHKAQLNFSDCFAYALAKDTGNALLFKGDNFDQTDIAVALP